MAVRSNIRIDAGSHYTLTIAHQDQRGNPINTSGWGARFMMRATPGPTGASVGLPQLTVGNGITNGGPTGVWTVTVTALQSLAFTSTTGFWDFYEDPGGSPDGLSYRLAEGAYSLGLNEAT